MIYQRQNMFKFLKAQYHIRHNIKAHAKVYDTYEQNHLEIFNPLEQQRLHESLERAIGSIRTSTNRKLGLDYGCGSGNVTNHLISLNTYTIAADVSEEFLSLVDAKYSHTGMLATVRVNGQDLSGLRDNCFDLVAAYSVLHHVPDYCEAIREMIRVLKHGGILYVDHEVNESYWNRSEVYNEFVDIVRAVRPKKRKSRKRFLKLSYYVSKMRRKINPRCASEGDIHVWPDDHIEWDKVEQVLTTGGCELVFKEDYLVFKGGYPMNLYKAYMNLCNDMRVLVARKG